MTIGPLTIMLQVQVIKWAPFEVLLGQLFFSLTACKTDDQPDGSQYITLTDPAMQRQIRLATKERGGERKQMREHECEGSGCVVVDATDF